MSGENEPTQAPEDYGPSLPGDSKHLRLECATDAVVWTGDRESLCWICEQAGVAIGTVSIYPDIL